MATKTKLSPEESIPALNEFIQQIFEVIENKGYIENLKLSNIHESVIEKLKTGTFEDKIKYCAFHVARYYNIKERGKYIDSYEQQTQAVMLTLYIYLVLLHGDIEDLNGIKTLNPNFEIKFINILKKRQTTPENLLEIIKKQIGPDRTKILEIELEDRKSHKSKKLKLLPEKQLPIDLKTIAFALKIYINSETIGDYGRIVRKMLNDREVGKNISSELVANPCEVFSRLDLTEDITKQIRHAKRKHEENSKKLKSKESNENLVNRLYMMSDIELKDYLKINSTVGTKLGEIKRKAGTPQPIIEKIDSIIERIAKIKKEESQQQRAKILKARSTDFFKFFDIMISEEIPDFETFAQKKYRELGYDNSQNLLIYVDLCKTALTKEESDDVYKKLATLKKKLFNEQWSDKISAFFGIEDTDGPKKKIIKLSKMSDEELADYVKKNRGILLEIEIASSKESYSEDLRDVLKKLKNRLRPLSYDIIDYYKMFNRPLPDIKRESALYLDDNALKSRMSRFFSKYYGPQSLTSREPEWESVPSAEYFGVEVSPEKERYVLEYLEKYNIPKNFFVPAFKRFYVYGKIDDDSIGQASQGQSKR